MSLLLLHAILDADAPGLPDELTRVATDHLAAWASAIEARRLGQEDMLAHHALVEQLWRNAAACIPARFPSVFADAEAIHTLLRARESELQSGLDRVRDRAELAVTAMWLE